tara:strand:+ start:1452 stop:1907 length:456 start_codon:yes stop_codon:yes gene_type:complete
MEIRIIRLGILHLDACIDLDQKSLKGLWSRSQWELELTDPKRICTGVINYENKSLLAICSAWLVIDELQITVLAVHPLHQRKGIGRFLFSDLIKRSKSNLMKHIYLEVKNTNHSAIAFYKSMGFLIVGNRSNFYKDGSDALIFKKHLNKKL